MKWSSVGKQCFDKSIWHKWFAWYPVCIRNHGGGHRYMVWFEQVQRKGKYVSSRYGWDYKYKLLEYVKTDSVVTDTPRELTEFESYVYIGENGCLYMLEEKTGRIWHLKGGDYAGEHGIPLPGYIEGIGKMTLLGVFNLSD